MSIHDVTEDKLNTWAGKPMRENEKELLYAIYDNSERIKWVLSNDGLEIHARLPGDYAAVIDRYNMYIIDIRDSDGQFINSIRPIKAKDRSAIACIYSGALKSTSTSEKVFGEIVEALQSQR